jgi:hypothetical protein
MLNHKTKKLVRDKNRMRLNFSTFLLKRPKFGCLFYALIQMQTSYPAISNTVLGDTNQANHMKPCRMSGVILETLMLYWLMAALSLLRNPSRLRSVICVTQTNPELFG